MRIRSGLLGSCLEVGSWRYTEVLRRVKCSSPDEIFGTAMLKELIRTINSLIISEDRDNLFFKKKFKKKTCKSSSTIDIKKPALDSNEEFFF
jgi:hypothetical protein